MSLIEPMLGTLFIVVPIVVLTCVPVIVILYKVYQRMSKCNFCLKNNPAETTTTTTTKQNGGADFQNGPIEWTDSGTPTGDDYLDDHSPDTDPNMETGSRKASAGLGWYHHRPGWLKKNQRPNQWMMRGGGFR